MKVEQKLSSGIIIRQDYSESVRAAFFQTDYEDFLYATHGGTIFLIQFQGRVYGLTCRHVFGDFEHGQLFITEEKQGKKGGKPANIVGIGYPSSPTEGAIESDVLDVCVIEFSDDTTADFFKGTPYILEERTVVTSKSGNRLEVAGVLKEKSVIDPPNITMGFCRLEFGDRGNPTSDPVLRHASAMFGEPQFKDVTGISGSPVFNITQNALCGMVVRGGMDGAKCNIHYIDAFDLVRILEAVQKKGGRMTYIKYVEPKR